LPAPRRVDVEASVFRALARTQPRPGARTAVALLDLEHGALRPVEIELAEWLRWHGVPARRVVVHEAAGFEWSAGIDTPGAVLEGESLIPGGGTRAWGPGDDERPVFAVDMTTWGRVLTAGRLHDPRRVRRLRLKLGGLPEKMGIPAEVVIEAAALPAG